MTADLTGKLPPGTRRIRISTNVQIYWNNILIDRTSQDHIRGIIFALLRFPSPTPICAFTDFR